MLVTSLGPDAGLEVIDPIERRRRTLRTPEPVDPVPADTDEFTFPVETAVRIETSAIEIPGQGHVCVRGDDGTMIEEIGGDTAREFPESSYSIEPAGIVRVHVRVESACSIRTGNDGVEIEFGDRTPVLVGSWSQHDRPAATVTTTDDPGDVLAAISTFGSALKTTTPERSFPSFRGHPPTVDVGPELEIPDGLEPPADDVRVEVPPEFRYLYPVAPLAYYLGAPIREGPVPRIAGPGIDHRLDEPDPFEATVRRTLKQIFLLDCVTRTEGIYQVDLFERSVLDDRLDCSFEALYEADHAERIRRYLDLPYDDLRDQVPDWQHAAHVEESVESVETLPYLVDDLAIVQIADAEVVPEDAVANGTAQGLVRGSASTVDSSFVHPTDRTDAIDEVWVGSGTPIGAAKAVPEAYRNRIGRTPSTDDIAIAVVCNADAMSEEHDVVDEVYRSRGDLPFEVDVERDTTTDRLTEILDEHHDFLHYIGHIDGRGFECEDGYLDAGALDSVGVDAFFLNACQSYEQGRELIRAGAIGGIVTLSDVINHGAVRIGRTVARLLNCGFPLKPALELARDESVIGSQYVVVGDSGLSVVQPESGTPVLVRLDKNEEHYELQLDLYGAEPGIGGLFRPHLSEWGKFWLASGVTTEVQLPSDEVEDLLQLEDGPIYYDGTLNWIEELSISDF